MQLNKLEPTKNLKQGKRVGRGESSGKGKTSGKGYKGQKSRGRGKIRLGFEGGQLPLIKRLPFKRGVGNAPAKGSLVVTLDQLKVYKAHETVDIGSLIKKGLIGKTALPSIVKIVAKGGLTQPLTVKVKTTREAKKLIEKAKGEVVESLVERKEAAVNV